MAIPKDIKIAPKYPGCLTQEVKAALGNVIDVLNIPMSLGMGFTAQGAAGHNRPT